MGNRQSTRWGCSLATKALIYILWTLHESGGIVYPRRNVTDLQGPPSERTLEEKLWDFKTRAQQYARDRGSCDDTRISYLEHVESEAEADWTLAWMIAG
jgi:hypothetical protein